MLRAHRQAWAWQDEWYSLTMDDIRQLERETQEALAKKMAGESTTAGTNETNTTVPLQEDIASQGDGTDMTLADDQSRSLTSWSPAISPRLHELRNLNLGSDPNADIISVGSADGRHRIWSSGNNLTRTGRHSPSNLYSLRALKSRIMQVTCH